MSVKRTTATAILLASSAIPALAQISSTVPLYGAELVGGASQFGTINSSSGAFTEISTLPSGLGWPLGDMANQSDPIDGLIFSSQSSSSGNVLTINKRTGASGWLSVPNYAGIVGYDNLKNNLIYFGVNSGTTQLYSFDIRTNTSKLIATGIPNGTWQAGGIGAVNSFSRVAYLFDSTASKVFLTNLDTGAQLPSISVPSGTIQVTLDEQHQTLVGLTSSGAHSELFTVDLKTGTSTVFTTPVATTTSNYVQAVSGQTSSYYFQGGSSSSTITIVSLNDGTIKGSFPAPLRLFALPEVVLGGDADSVYQFGINDPSTAVVKEGTGTVTLTGNSSYEGGTQITAGGLSISSDNNLGNGGTLTMAPNTTLAFTGGGTYSHSVTMAGDPTFDVSAGQTVTYSGLISDGASPGTLEKTGDGTLIVTAANTYTGGTDVMAGALTVMGSLAGPVTVNGGKLNGNGTVGAVTVASGTFAPGDAVGIMHVNGNLSLASGTTYAVEVTPTAADEAIVSGTATIASGTTLAISPDAGTYASNTIYTLLSATGGVTGTFSAVTYNGSFGTNVVPLVSYDAGNVFLALKPALICSSGIAPSANRMGACTAIANAGPGASLYLATSNLSASASTVALAQLSGDIHASMRSAMIEDGKIIRDTVINHVISASDTATIWAAGFSAYGAIDSDGNAAALHHNDSGVIVGADAPVVSGFHLGVGAALTTQRMNLPAESASASGSTDHLIGYANWTDQTWVASLGVDFGWGANQVARRITQFSETDSDHQTNRLTQVFGEVGYRVPEDVFDLMALEPYLDLADVTARTNAFSETGGVGALSGAAKSANENYLTFGLRAAAPEWSVGDFGVVPNLNVGWQHALGHLLPSQTLTFAETGQSFTVLGVPLGTDAATIQAGLDIGLSPAAILSVGYDGEISSRVQDHAIRAELSWKF